MIHGLIKLCTLIYIGYNVIIALKGQEHGVILPIEGLPIGYSVVVAMYL